jgi:hypothetical protein
MKTLVGIARGVRVLDFTELVSYIKPVAPVGKSVTSIVWVTVMSTTAIVAGDGFWAA